MIASFFVLSVSVNCPNILFQWGHSCTELNPIPINSFLTQLLRFFLLIQPYSELLWVRISTYGIWEHHSTHNAIHKHFDSELIYCRSSVICNYCFIILYKMSTCRLFLIWNYFCSSLIISSRRTFSSIKYSLFCNYNLNIYFITNYNRKQDSCKFHDDLFLRINP
jgi:hypothetical protein